ncbi:MAG: SAM-dependent methyltransferase [Akkermansia sp.]
MPSRRVFEYTEQDWKEVGLVVKNGAVREELRPVRQQPLFSHMLEYDSQPGQRLEIHDSYARWFTGWLPLWNMGVMTVIDYGDEMERLYYRRPQGSLRGYKSHQVLTGEELYRHPGLTDLTCDVNFTDLLELSRNCLGDTVTLMTQRDYLLPYAENTPQDAFLTDEHGAGGHFHVLIQERL